MKKIIDKADINNLPSFMEFVNNYAMDASINAGNIQKIELALEEALVNIIHYAYKDTTPDSIEIQCEILQQDSMSIRIIDKGAAFDILQKEDPDTSLSIEDREIGGLGIFLVKQMMDETHYKRENNKNILTLIKHN